MKVIEFYHSVTTLARPTLPKRENFSAIIYIKVSYDDYHDKGAKLTRGAFKVLILAKLACTPAPAPQ